MNQNNWIEHSIQQFYPAMYLTLSHDHRLVDGLLGGMFLKFIKDSLENYDLAQI